MDYLSGDVVWCKYAGYPTWPSIVRDHEEVCEELEGMGVKRIGKPRPTEVCVQYLGYGDTKYFGKQAKNKIWPYSPYRDDKMNEGQKRRLKAFDVAVIEADVIISDHPPRPEMMEKVTEVSMKKIKPGKKQMRGQKSESASRRNSNAKEHTFQKLDDSIVEVRDEEADDETEDERDTEDADFSPNKAENQQKIMKRKQKEVEKLPAKKMKFTLPLSRSKLKKHERKTATIESLNKIREELEEAMSGIAEKIEKQNNLKAKYDSVKKEFEVAKKAMEDASDTFETAKASVDQTVSKLRSCTEELDLMDNVDIEKIKQSSIGRTLKRLFKIKDIGPREVSGVAALAKTIKQRWMDSLAPQTQPEEVPRDQELQPEPPEQFNSLEEENYDKSDMGEKDTPVDEEDKDMNVDEPEVEDEEADVHIPKETPDDDNKEDLKDNEPAEAEPQANGYKNEEDVEPKQEEANNQDENKTQVAS